MAEFNITPDVEIRYEDANLRLCEAFELALYSGWSRLVGYYFRSIDSIYIIHSISFLLVPPLVIVPASFTFSLLCRSGSLGGGLNLCRFFDLLSWVLSSPRRVRSGARGAGNN